LSNTPETNAVAHFVSRANDAGASKKFRNQKRAEPAARGARAAAHSGDGRGTLPKRQARW